MLWHPFFFIQHAIGGKVTDSVAETVVGEPVVVQEAIPQENISDSLLTKAELNPVAEGSVKIVLNSGKTLRLLAEEKFGSREFWIYIYLKNKDKISNPDKVATGTELIMPDAKEYGIEASNPESISKAKSLSETFTNSIHK